MGGLGFEIRVLKTMVSPKEKGISKVNIRLQAGWMQAKPASGEV
jgi:hypothetical protein